MPKKYRRREGDLVLYTPNQTQRYKSQWTRYQKGLALAESNNIIQVDENIYRVPSERSPIGYWEVKLGEDPAQPIVSVTFGYSFDIYSNGILVERVINNDAMGDDVNIYETMPLAGDYIDLSEVSDYGDFEQWPDTATLPFPDLPYKSLEGYTYEEEGSGVAVVYFVFIIELETEIIRLGRLIGRTVGIDQGSIENLVAVFIIEYEDSTSGTVDLENNVPNIGSGNDQSNGGDYECTCPDFSKFEDAFVPPPFESMASPRDWGASEAGAPAWADGKRRCYHIVGVQQVRGEDIPVPTDFPLGEA